MSDLSVLKNQMASLLGENQPGRIVSLEARVEQHEVIWQRAKGFAAAISVLFALINVALRWIRK